MTSQFPDLEHMEPGDDPLSDQVFDILRKTLTPQGDVSTEAAVEQILALLPEGRPYSNEVDSFVTTCYEIAEQIPYTHPSMIKLATIIYLCMNSSKFESNDRAGVPSTDRYQAVGEALRDWWNSVTPSEDAVKYVNFQAFAARLQERGVTSSCSLAKFTLDYAFEDNEGKTSEERSAHVIAASQWILVRGDAIYAEVTEGNISQKKWKKWHDGFNSVATRKADSKKIVYSEEAVQSAGRAAVAMEAIERQKAG